MWKMAHLLWQNDCWCESNFRFLYWLFQNWQIAWWFEIKSPMSEFLQFLKSCGAVSSSCNAWNNIMQACLKKQGFFYISVGRKLPGDVLPQKYQPIWQPFQSVAQNCVRFKKKMRQKIRLHIPLSGENSSSKGGSASWGLYVAVTQSEYIGKNRGLKGRARADGGQWGCIWSHQSLCEYCRAEVLHPHQACDIQGLFPLWHSNGIFYGDFTFPCPSTWKEMHSLSF